MRENNLLLLFFNFAFSWENNLLLYIVEKNLMYFYSMKKTKKNPKIENKIAVLTRANCLYSMKLFFYIVNE